MHICAKRASESHWSIKAANKDYRSKQLKKRLQPHISYICIAGALYAYCLVVTGRQNKTLVGIVAECCHTVKLDTLRELVGGTHAFGFNAVGRDIVTLNESLLHSIGTSLRQLLVKLS